MCSKPKVPAPDTRLQDESLKLQGENLKLQKEQMEVAKEQSRRQMAMALETQRIQTAPPPPLPNKTAQVAALPLDSSGRAVAIGRGRRRMRTDRTYSTLAIV